MEISSPNGIVKNVKNLFGINRNVLVNQEILCANYLYRFMELNDKKAYRDFKKIFEKLPDEKRFQVINHYLIYSKTYNQRIKVKKK